MRPLYADDDTPAGTFHLDISRNGVSATIKMHAISDTLAVGACYDVYPDWRPNLASILAPMEPGDELTLQAYGMELTNRFVRTSATITMPCSTRIVYGALQTLSADFDTTVLDVSKGDTLAIVGSYTPDVGGDMLTCPALWSGSLPFLDPGLSRGDGPGWIGSKCFPLTTAGTFTINNATRGTSLTVNVHEAGVAATRTYGYAGGDLCTDGAVVGFGGARIIIPPGALPADALSADHPSYLLRAEHNVSPFLPFDPIVTDGGQSYTLHFDPEPPELLKPITISLPYDPENMATPPIFGLQNPTGDLYYDLGGVADTTKHTVTLTLPAGSYAGGGSYAIAATSEPAAASASSILAAAPVIPKLTFNNLVDKIAAVSNTDASYLYEDPIRKLRVDCDANSASPSYVSAAYANEVLAVAQSTYDNLDGHGWPPPTDWVVLFVRDLGTISPRHGIGNQGATTKAVFGQPYVYVNKQCTSGTQLDTAVSHEMGHVFERQISWVQNATNWVAKWIDEAAAEWVAFDTLGSGADLRASIEFGNGFASLQIPTGFALGYDTEQAYAAGALIIWMAKQYGPGAVLSIYNQLKNTPSFWSTSYPVLTTATGGATMADIAGGFGAAYWKQEYDPVKGLALGTLGLKRLQKYWEGVTSSEARPPYSSFRVSVGPADDFKAQLAGSDLYVDATGLGADQTIEIYGDTAGAGNPPAASLFKMATLTSLKPDRFIGKYGSYSCYRFIVLNRSASETPTIGLTVEPVHIDDVSPTLIRHIGGDSVTLTGHGFGNVKGYVMVGAAIVQNDAITAWSHSSITFRLPNMGSTTGPQNVIVRPDTDVADVRSNTETLTLTE
jgi:hypothetical protein